MSNPCAKIDVLLLAAGFGKRLKPLTDITPKPLIDIGGESLLDRHLRQLEQAGFKRVFINMHHLAPQISAHLKQVQSTLKIIPIYEPILLDTGGAIKNIAQQVQSEHLLTVNSDIVIDQFPYAELLQTHLEDQASPLATLVIRKDVDAKKFGEIEIDQDRRITSFIGTNYLAGPAEAGYMYTGVQILSRNLFARMPIQNSVFSITRDVYPHTLSLGAVMKSFVFSGIWFDTGTPKTLEEAKKWIFSLKQ